MSYQFSVFRLIAASGYSHVFAFLAVACTGLKAVCRCELKKVEVIARLAAAALWIRLKRKYGHAAVEMDLRNYGLT